MRKLIDTINIKVPRIIKMILINLKVIKLTKLFVKEDNVGNQYNVCHTQNGLSDVLRQLQRKNMPASFYFFHYCYQEISFKIYVQKTFCECVYVNGEENCVGKLRSL